ncbi:MAG: DnaJ domain-containing protein [Caldilinea sp.]|nr:DnaJ domain-containing protein [Caldilinea sp.]MDW8441333.1 DnaJ domain-containing protein [Caldilineaceae bacterium]
MASGTYYQILQVAPDATQAEIAAAYRRLARQVHPDLNPSPAAHRRMQELNEAYNTLRHPDRRRRYDEMLAAAHCAPDIHRPHEGTSNVGRAATRTRAGLGGAWLSYQKRVGEEIVFVIGHADNMADLLADLQRRIPASARRYDIAQNRWRVHVAYEDVLRTFFRNYAPVMRNASTAGRNSHSAPSRHAAQRVYPRRARPRERRILVGVASAILMGAALWLVLMTQTLASNRGVSATPGPLEPSGARSVRADAESLGAALEALTFPEDCVPAVLEAAPAYFREACKTLEPEFKDVTHTRPYALATTRVASNIRSGPDTRFPVLTTAPPGARIQLVGYTVSRGYVWFLTNFGGWIRGDLLTEPPMDLPPVGM